MRTTYLLGKATAVILGFTVGAAILGFGVAVFGIVIAQSAG